ncbi:MAG TPA: GNAT family N-acetyltransferase [Methyloceanibacter sp.]|jgi:GNAT superfamily N-acetyltransferase|nr:GNAT family N-acetyltransferase [Methyloceanibacter sp.]
MGEPQGSYRIERMPFSEVETTIDWAAREGWNPGLGDAACFYTIDPDGFFMGVLDGRPIARVAMPIYDEHFAFCGLYIVDPAYRGRGYGLQLTKASLDYIGGRNAALDGVEAMAEKYARLGYRRAHRSTRYMFTPQRAVTPGREIVPIARVPFAKLAAYDRAHFLAPRERFLERWISQPSAVALAFVDGSELNGYGVLRKCRVGYKIGPLFAEAPEIAEALYGALCNHAIGEPVFIDIPEPNQAGLKLAAKHHMRSDFACERMYLRGDPGLPLDAIYGITTFEAG